MHIVLADALKMTREQLSAYPVNELDSLCRSAHAEADKADAERRRLLTVANGREPTDNQRAALDAAVESRTEHRALATRVHEITQQVRNQPVTAPALPSAGPSNSQQRWGDEQLDNTVDHSRTVAVGVGYENQTRVTRGEMTYRPDTRNSFLLDVYRSGRGDHAATERLHRNNTEFRVENRALAGNIAGAVGEFVPPVWLMQALVRVARPGRVFADQINNQVLNVQTNTIDIPRLTGGTAVAQQTTENTAVQNTDATSDSISSIVATLAGQQVVSVQLLDQSPVSMDQILLEDLTADLAVKTDRFVLSSSGTGQVGVLNLSGINSVTYTDASPTLAEAYPKVSDAIQRVSTLRYMEPDKIFMHPRRWAWMTAALDTANRPLVVPQVQAPQNSAAAQGSVVAAGLVGSMQGLPVYVDANIPINLGSGTNEDRIIVTRSQDLFLWESVPYVLVDPYSQAANLSVRVRLHRYVSVQHGRYPTAVSVISGTGLATPTF